MELEYMSHPFKEFVKLDQGLLERLHPLVKDLREFLISIQRPPSFMFIRINTIKVDIEEYVGLLRDRGIDYIRDPDVDEAVGFKVMGPNEIGFIAGYKKVVVDKRAAESVMLGSDLYAPGVVSARGLSKGDKVVVLAPNGMSIAKGVALMSEDEIFSRRRGLAVKVTRSLYSTVKFSELPGVAEGYFYAQSLPSMVAVRMLDPKPGELIVDLTAAPGGKISYVAQLTGRYSKIIAVDRRSKTKKLKETLIRLGIHWVEIIGGDSRYLDKMFPNLKGKVDKVIIDPPCSSLGVRPKVYEVKRLRDVISSMLYQRAFIKVAKSLLKRGGRALYSTCTVTWEENELNTDYAEELGFKVVEPPEWVKKRWYYNKKGVRFCPLRHDTPGFYATILEV